MCRFINMMLSIYEQIIDYPIRNQHHQRQDKVLSMSRSKLHRVMVVSTFSCLATSLAEDPETSIHVLENKAQAESMKTM